MGRERERFLLGKRCEVRTQFQRLLSSNLTILDLMYKLAARQKHTDWPVEKSKIILCSGQPDPAHGKALGGPAPAPLCSSGVKWKWSALQAT